MDKRILLGLLCISTSASAGANPRSMCQAKSDCLLVQESWCKRVIAIPKKNQNEWLKKDQENAKQAAEKRQTCKVSLGPELEIKNFTVECQSGRCVALFQKL